MNRWPGRRKKIRKTPGRGFPSTCSANRLKIKLYGPGERGRGRLVAWCHFTKQTLTFQAASARGSAPLKPLAQSTKPRWGWMVRLRSPQVWQADRPLYGEPEGFSPGWGGDGKSTFVA